MNARRSAREDRRRQLLRKELAWLRRGPPARTSKPKFRIEAANALIADEPEVRDRVELLRFASARLGDKVLEAVNVFVEFGTHEVLRAVTLRLGPGDRVALLGANGSGKTTLLRLLAGELEPTRGEVERGTTVRLAHLSQDTGEIPGHLRVLESLEEVRGIATLSDGRELTAGSLCERFGFRGDRTQSLVQDLSGGERRRLQLMRLLMEGPNVLLLDEPTNDLDIDTLTALEDLLDALARHACDRQPRSLLRRARIRLGLRDHGRWRASPSPRRRRAIPPAALRTRPQSRHAQQRQTCGRDTRRGAARRAQGDQAYRSSAWTSSRPVRRRCTTRSR